MATYSAADGTKIIEVEVNNVTMGGSTDILEVPLGETYFLESIICSNDINLYVEVPNSIGITNSAASCQIQCKAYVGTGSALTTSQDGWSNKHAQVRLFPGDKLHAQGTLGTCDIIVRVIATVHNG